MKSSSSTRPARRAAGRPAADAASRFERRKARTRGDLVAAATRVFAARGFAATKIADIATAADVGVGTFYLHFDTKEALLAAVVDDTMTRLKREVDAARDVVDDPVARVRASNAAICGFAGAHRELFAIVFGPGAAHVDVVQRAVAVFAADLEAQIADGVARGAFVSLPAPVVAQAAVGMTTHLLAWWTGRNDVPLSALEETMNRLVLDGLQRRPDRRKGT